MRPLFNLPSGSARVRPLPSLLHRPTRPQLRPILECLLLCVALFVLAAPADQAWADTTQGKLVGHVTTADGTPVTDAEVDLVDLRLHSHVDAEGLFTFEDLPAGSYLVRIESRSQGDLSRRVDITAGETTETTFIPALVSHEDEVVVTASGIARSQLELAQTTTVLTGEDLRFRQQSTLGETLSQQPGISSTSFGQGASRPVIRGLGGDRVRMLQGGVDSGDASSTSPDHAVTTDPALAERIEVLRGPSTLLYGSSAIGGVVNVDDGSIPDSRPEAEVGGFVDMSAGSVSGEKGVAAALTGGGGDWAWHASTSFRDADDYDIPGHADVDPHGDEDDHGDGDHGDDDHGDDDHGDDDHDDDSHDDEEENFGTLENSSVESQSLTVGLSRFFGNKGFVGVSVSGFESDYGIPGGGHSHEEGHDDDHDDDHGDDDHDDDHGDEDEHAGDIRIDMKRQRVDLRAEITEPFGAFQGFKARIGVVDYEHDEVEGDGTVGTSFFNDSIEARFEWIQKRRGDLTGSFGLQILNREQEAVGEEAFLPASDSTHIALFAFEELEKLDGDLRFQFGARYESVDVDNEVGLRSRSFEGVSASLGLVWEPVDGWALALSGARSTKLPNAEELYSNGPHFATRAFEIGNVDLEEEIATGLDLSLRKTAGRLTAELSVFRNDFDDFIYQELTGEMEDGLDVVRFAQADALIRGMELKARLELWESGGNHLDLSVTGDKVKAELDDGSYLPRIAPRRVSLGLHFHTPSWHSYLEIWDVDAQDRLAQGETPTDGYTMVNAGLSYRFLTGTSIYDLILRGRNLTDEDARNHVSFLKDTVPLPGRDISLALRWTF